VGNAVDIGAFELGDFTAQIQIRRSGFRYNRATNRFVQQLNVTNQGDFITGPFFVVLLGLNNDTKLVNVTPEGVIGVTENLEPGSPFIEFFRDLPQTSGFGVYLEFSSPPATGITYSTRVLSGAGTP
jgi:hypothetical protein